MKEKRLMSKDEFVKLLQDNVEKVTGEKIALTTLWNIFKVCIYSPFEISNNEDVRISIPKIGVFTTSKILESFQKNGKIRPKFYGSSTIEDALTSGASLIDMVAESYTAKQDIKEPENPAKKETKEEKPAKKETKEEKPEKKEESKKASAKKGTKPSPVKTMKIEDVEDEEAENSNDEDDFDFDSFI